MKTFTSPAMEVIDLCESLLDDAHGPLNEEQRDFSLVILRNAHYFVQLTNRYAEIITQMRNGQTYSGITHEWRTPLVSVIGYSELLADGLVGPVTPSQSAVYRQINLLGAGLRDAIQKLAEFAKTSSTT